MRCSPKNSIPGFFRIPPIRQKNQTRIHQFLLVLRGAIGIKHALRAVQSRAMLRTNS